MVEVRDGARVGEEERIAAQAGGDGGSNGGRKQIDEVSERVSRPFDDGGAEREQTCTCPKTCTVQSLSVIVDEIYLPLLTHAFRALPRPET